MATKHPGPEQDWHDSLYHQLHDLASAALAREKPGHSLQPTLLVNDAYLRLQNQRNVQFSDRSQVMAAGATIIRRLLVDYARRRKAEKRGGAEKCRVTLPEAGPNSASQLDLIDLNDALDNLAGEHSRAARVVEMRFFGGLTMEEIGAELNVSSRTITNDWLFAKTWLYRVLGSHDSSTDAS